MLSRALPHALSPAPAAPCSRAPRAGRVARPPPQTAGAQGTDPRPKTRRPGSPIWLAAPGLGGEVSRSTVQAWRAVAAAGCRFLALEILSLFLSPGCVGPPSFPGWQCRRNDRSRLRTLPAPAPDTPVSSSLSPGEARGQGVAASDPGFRLLFYRSPRPSPASVPSRRGEESPEGQRWPGEPGTAALGDAPWDPAASGGQGTAPSAPSAWEAPTPAGGGDGGDLGPRPCARPARWNPVPAACSLPAVRPASARVALASSQPQPLPLRSTNGARAQAAPGRGSCARRRRPHSPRLSPTWSLFLFR